MCVCGGGELPGGGLKGKAGGMGHFNVGDWRAISLRVARQGLLGLESTRQAA